MKAKPPTIDSVLLTIEFHPSIWFVFAIQRMSHCASLLLLMLSRWYLRRSPVCLQVWRCRGRYRAGNRETFRVPSSSLYASVLYSTLKCSIKSSNGE